jgi:sugar phosphate isomerase/epimerase
VTRLRLGINNCFAVKRWPLPDEWAQIVGGELDLRIVQHSLDLAELAVDDAAIERQGRDVREACARASVSVESVFTGLAAYSTSMMLAPAPPERRRGVEYWTRAIRLAAALDATAVGGHVGSLSRTDADDPVTSAARWEELDRQLDGLRRIAAAHGVPTLLVENMACDREPSRMAQLRGMMREADSGRSAVALCLDVGHQCVPGTSGDERDPYAWLRELGDQASVVHLQQTSADGDGHWPFTAERNRAGRIAGRRVLAALAESGASDVSLILEVIPAFEADDRVVLNELRETVEYWKQELAAFGASDTVS